MADECDVLIVNKFGKFETEGRGFRNLIATAVERDIPVLVGINAYNQNAFLQFAAGMAVSLPPIEAALARWVKLSAHGSPTDGLMPFAADPMYRAVPHR